MPELDGFAVAERIRCDPELAGATIMMISSTDRNGDAVRCRELGIACCLRKPITQSELFDAILTAMGSVPLQETPSPLAAAAETMPGHRCLRILVAEDNEVNQELAIKTLEKRGHTVLVVGDGREALAAFEREAIDLVLMDVQMPVMDGFAATAAIREREKLTGGRIPIVALTAHAMKGDRERCLASGMDAYVTKPLRVEELFAAIGRFFPGTPATSADADGIAPADSQSPPAGQGGRVIGAVFDSVWALARVEGDVALLRKLIDLFTAQTRKLLPEIRSAGERRDGPALERYAHKLRGSMGSFEADRATEAALQLEIMGRDDDCARIEETVASLECEVGRLQESLTTFTQAEPKCVS